MTPNQIRDKAQKMCAKSGTEQSAREAWLRVAGDPRCHGKTIKAARLAMLQVLADGGTVAEAEKAGWEVLQ